MRRLLLMRHATAAPDDGKGDHARPLDGRGLEEARRVGALLRKLAVPDEIVASDSARTAHTAQIVASGCGARVQPRLFPRLYGAGLGSLQQVVGGAPKACRSLLVVAHHPAVPVFAGFLSGSLVELEPGSGVLLEVEPGVGWAEGSGLQGGWRLVTAWKAS